MKKAVCLLIDTIYGYIVVSRRDSITEWGFPGGKVDEGETLEEAILREVYEEIGIEVPVDMLRKVYTGPCLGGIDYETTTYYIRYDSLDISLLEPEEGLTVGVADESVLCDESYSPFADYNKRMFAAKNTWYN